MKYLILIAGIFSITMFGLGSCGGLKQEHTEKTTLKLDLNYSGAMNSRSTSAISTSALSLLKTQYIMIVPAGTAFPNSRAEADAITPVAEGLISGDNATKEFTVPQDTSLQVFAFLFDHQYTLSELRASTVGPTYGGKSSIFSVSSSSSKQALTIALNNLKLCLINMSSEKDTNDNGTIDIKNTVVWTYDSNRNQLTQTMKYSQDYGATNSSTDNSTTVWTYYSDGNWLTEIKEGVRNYESYKDNSTRSYDSTGNWVKEVQEQAFTYLGSTQQSSTITYTKNRSYDSTGNWLTETREYTSGGTTTADYTITRTYNSDGNWLTEVRKGASNGGTTTADYTITRTYNSDGNWLTEVRKGASNTTHDYTATRTFDSNGNWLTETEDNSYGSNTRTRTYNSDGNWITEVQTGTFVSENANTNTNANTTTTAYSKTRTYATSGYPTKDVTKSTNTDLSSTETINYSYGTCGG